MSSSPTGLLPVTDQRTQLQARLCKSDLAAFDAERRRHRSLNLAGGRRRGGGLGDQLIQDDVAHCRRPAGAMVTRQWVTRKVCKAVVKMHTKYSWVNIPLYLKPLLSRTAVLHKNFTPHVVLTVFDVYLDCRSNRKRAITLSASADANVLIVLFCFSSWPQSVTDNTMYIIINVGRPWWTGDQILPLLFCLNQYNLNADLDGLLQAFSDCQK